MAKTFGTTGAGIPKLVWIICLNILAVAGSLFVLYQTRRIVAWILIALLFALALDPAVQFLERKRFRRSWAIVTVFVGVAGLIALLVATVLPMLIHQGRSLFASAPDMLEKLRGSGPFQWADEQFDLLDRAKQGWAENVGAAAGPLFKVVEGVFTGAIGTITVIVLTVFMLAFGGQLFGMALEWIEPYKRERYIVLSKKIRRAVGKYVTGTLLIALMGGVVTAGTLAILRVPYFLALGLAMTLLGVLPFIGPVLGALLVVGTTFLTAGMKAGIISLVVFLVYQQVENHLLQPIVQRKTIKMNALLIAMVMLVGTALAGILGALISLPIAAAIQVVFQDVLERRKARWAHASGQCEEEQFALPEQGTDPKRSSDGTKPIARA